MFKNGWMLAFALGVASLIMVTFLSDCIDDQEIEIQSLQCDIQFYEKTVEAFRSDVEMLTYRQLPLTNIRQLPTSVTQTFRIGDWDYIVTTYNPGTRSEGHNAILAKDGNEILPEDLTNKRATVETPWGVMLWQGHIDDRKHVWNNSGWRVIFERVEE